MCYVYVVNLMMIDVELVLFFCFYFIVENMLYRVNVKIGEWVFIIGVLGGVGLVVV